MCLVVCAFQQHPDYPLILLANRDEFFARPTEPLHRWPNGIVAGKDLQEGGSWLGIRGRTLAILTNYRDGREAGHVYPQSRGNIITDLLLNKATVDTDFSNYGGFNALTLDSDEQHKLHYLTNRGQPMRLMPGVYGMSNHLLDTPWPKVSRLKTTFSAELHRSNPTADWFSMLRDERQPAPHFIPDTHIPAEFEQHLSSIFIPNTPQFGRAYGTRCSTLATLNNAGQWHIIEQTYDETGNISGTVDLFL